MTPIPEFITPPEVPKFARVVAKQHIWLWLATTVAIALGFRFLSPNERIATLEVHDRTMQHQVDTVLAHQAQSHDWQCLKSTLTEQQLLHWQDCKMAAPESRR